MFDDIVTLFCRVGNEKEGKFTRYVIEQVHMAELYGEAVGVAMASATDRAQVIVPYATCDAYVPPIAWRALSEESHAMHFTLQIGDVFVRGAVPEDDIPVSAHLARRGGWKITSVAEKGKGSTLHHFAVGAGRLWSQTGGVL